MKIKLKIQGQERIIKQDGPNSFIPYKIDGVNVLGYYSSLNSAVSRLIKDVAVLDENGKEEVIEIKEYVNRHKALFDEIMGMDPIDIAKNAEFEPTPIKGKSKQNKEEDPEEEEEVF